MRRQVLIINIGRSIFNEKLQKISVTNKKNKKKYSTYKVGLCEMLKASIPGIRNRDPKLRLFNKCFETAENYLSVDIMIRRLMEVTLLKKLLLGSKKEQLFDQQFKAINVTNPEASDKYLDLYNLDKDVEFDYDKYLNEHDINGDELLLDGFADHYNEKPFRLQKEKNPNL
jgi:hypothetical protein